MDMHLHDKTVIVTGASRGIGLAISQAFAAAGAYVIAGARRTSPQLQALESAGSATFIAADLATPDGPQTLVAAATERGGVDVLVNNAGAVSVHPGGFQTVTDQDWAAAFELNLMSAVRTTRAAIPQMVARGGGSIVMIGSVNAVLPDPNIIEYTVTKAALANLSKGLSMELGPKGIRVNAISPGPVTTDLWLAEGGVADSFSAATGASAQDVVESVGATAVTGRFTTPQEVADLAVFLASDRSANTTGADVRIDGGFVTTL
jgi:NAD(P)-dependent dehydrogenase (short-subunit alcohol dehydrogenase family)